MAGLDGTIDIAGKKVSKKSAAIAAVGVVGIGILYERHKSAGSSVASAATTAATDPQTGYPTGSPQDLAALANSGSAIGTTSPFDSSSFTGGQVIGYDGMGNPIYGPGTGGVGTIAGPGTFSNNAEWAQAFEQQIGSIGNDAPAAALGKYLTGQSLSSDQQTIISEAIASQGYPPVAGPSGYPPSMKTAPVVNPPVTTTGGGTTVPQAVVPNVVHAKTNTAVSALQRAGFKAGIHQNSTSTTVVTSQTPGGGTKAPKGSTVDLGLS